MKLRPAQLLWLLPCSLMGAEFQGEIYSIDAKAGSITLSSKSRMKTYRVRPGAEISINGIKGKFEELNTGMTAKVVSADPTIASTIKAVGIPNRLSSGPVAGKSMHDATARALAEKLGNTRWKLENGKSFTLHADGTTSSSWHERRGTWEMVGGHTLETSITWKPETPGKATVNPEVNTIRWIDGKDVAHRIKN